MHLQSKVHNRCSINVHSVQNPPSHKGFPTGFQEQNTLCLQSNDEPMVSIAY